MASLLCLCSLLLLVVQSLAQEYRSSNVKFNADKWWEDGIEHITAANYEELIVKQPDQIWLLMLAKKRNDLSLRALGVY